MTRPDAAALKTADLAVLGGTANRVDTDIEDLKLRGGAVSGGPRHFSTSCTEKW